MKPDEEMHAGAEEVELEPSNFFIDIATLIIEGRVPGLSDRGFAEGPHCRPLHGQNRHVCDQSSQDCQQYEQLEKHMLLLWKNGIPMSVEVLLYPDCCQPAGKNIQVETSSVPETSSCTLLEQWTLHMPQRRVADACVVPKGLLQAVRSFLHFSQLSAWLSLGKGKITTNIHYRICVPGEAFSTKFKYSPDVHAFPVVNVGRSHAMNVMVKSLPRQGEFPKVPCLKHGVGLVPLSSIASAPLDDFGLPRCSSGMGELKLRDFHNFPERPKKDTFDRYSGRSTRKKALQRENLSDKNSSPVSNTSLGDCLLDPPQSLLMYPKRYQSPSRCGSPSLEVPEHLMFGLGAVAASTSKVVEPLHPLNPITVPSHQTMMGTRDRSRPQRRPVVERFLKKQYGVPATGPRPTSNNVNQDCDRLKRIDQTKKQLEGTRLSMNSSETNNHYPGKYPPKEMLDDRKLEGEEMRLVLDNLRQRYPASKLTMMAATLEENRQNSSNSLISHQNYLLNSSTKCMKMKKLTPDRDSDKNQEILKTVENWDARKHFKQTQPSISISKDNQWFRDHLLTRSDEKRDKTNESVNVEATVTSLSSSHVRKHSNELKNNGQESLDANLNPEISDNQSDLKDGARQDENLSKEITNVKKVDYEVTSEEMEDVSMRPDQSVSSKILAHAEEYKSNNTSSKDEHRDLLLNNSQSINASKRILGRNYAYLYYKMLKSNINLPMQDHDKGSSSPDRNSHLIPSAAEKLKFRRSLDSATCMVFHQNTGLPLTSSPAPIRKSGTCFDFDSSLTSVAAIKKALFEKDPELDEETKRLLSSSAPASTTTSNLLGNFEESVLNGRLEPVSTVEGFTAEIGASGSFCPRHKTLPVTVFFYTLHDIHNKVTSPYLGHINLGRKGYNIPKKGTVQVTLFNPHRTVVKMFVVRYDLSDMPPCSQTFLRQRTLYMPTGAMEDDEEARKWLRYLIHLRFASSKSGKIYLHTDIRMIIFRKSDLDAATIHGERPYELRSFTQGPKNPKFSPCK